MYYGGRPPDSRPTVRYVDSQNKSLQTAQVLSTVARVAELGRRDRKKQQTRAALIAAALRLADERGLDQITVEDISEAADVSSRTFFNYFSSKDEAITSDYVVEDEPLPVRFLAVPAAVPVIGAVRLALLPAIAQIEADRELWKVRMRVIDANPTLLPRLFANIAEGERALIDAVAARTGVGADHTYPQLIVAVAGAAVRTAMTRWAASGAERSLGGLLDEAFMYLASGLPDPIAAEELVRATDLPALAHQVGRTTTSKEDS